MSKIKSVCVYCSASDAVDQVYKDAAAEFGAALAGAGKKLVFGGGHVGLMGIVADSMMAAGGEAVGVSTRDITEMEQTHDNLTELYIADNMHERKMRMVRLSDAFVIFPGGVGTLDEFFAVFTWKILRFHDKPIVIANIAGYWDPLLNILEHQIDKKFVRAADLDYLKIVDRVEDILSALEEAPAPAFQEEMHKV